VNLFLLLTLLTAAPVEATGTPCEPVEGAPGDDRVPSQPALVRWARSHLGPEAARLVGTLDWEQLSWSGSEGRYLAPPPSSSGWQEILLALLSRGDAPPRQRQAAVKLLATVGQHFDRSVQSALRALLLTRRLAPKEAAALDLVARAPSEGNEAPALFTVEGDAPPRLWVDGQEVSGWAPRAKGFEAGTALHGFLLVRAEWPHGEAQDFWAALGPGVRLHLRTDQGPRQESAPQGERCVALEGTDARWSCETESLPRQGPLQCPSQASLQSAIALSSERKDGAEATLVFVPSLPGRYTFRWHGPHIDGRWSPGCDGP